MPVLAVLASWLVFGGSHVLLSTAPIRGRLEARLGRKGFPWLFSAVAWGSFAALVATYATVRFAGPPGLDLARLPWLRMPLVAAIVLGFAFMAGALAPSGYFDSPSALWMEGVRPPWGLERITRHPFFTGTVLLAGAHGLLASRLTGTVFFSGFVLLAVFGTRHQGGKLRERHGAPFAQYLHDTSAIPFVAILRGRQRLALRELPWVGMALGVAIAFAVRRVHEGILAWHGAPFIVAVVGGSMAIGAISARRAARLRAPAP